MKLWCLMVFCWIKYPFVVFSVLPATIFLPSRNAANFGMDVKSNLEANFAHVFVFTSIPNIIALGLSRIA